MILTQAWHGHLGSALASAERRIVIRGRDARPTAGLAAGQQTWALTGRALGRGWVAFHLRRPRRPSYSILCALFCWLFTERRLGGKAMMPLSLFGRWGPAVFRQGGLHRIMDVFGVTWSVARRARRIVCPLVLYVMRIEGRRA